MIVGDCYLLEVLELAKMTGSGWITINGAHVKAEPGQPINFGALKDSESTTSDPKATYASARDDYIKARDAARDAKVGTPEHADAARRAQDALKAMSAAREKAGIPSDDYQAFAIKAIKQVAMPTVKQIGDNPNPKQIKAGRANAEKLAKAIKTWGVGSSGGKSIKDIESDFGVTDTIRKAYPDLFSQP